MIESIDVIPYSENTINSYNNENLQIVCCVCDHVTYAPEVGPEDGDCGMETELRVSALMYVSRIVGGGVVAVVLWRLFST